MVADKFIHVETKDPGVKYQKFPEIEKPFSTMASPKFKAKTKFSAHELTTY